MTPETTALAEALIKLGKFGCEFRAFSILVLTARYLMNVFRAPVGLLLMADVVSKSIPLFISSFS